VTIAHKRNLKNIKYSTTCVKVLHGCYDKFVAHLDCWAFTRGTKQLFQTSQYNHQTALGYQLL